MVGCRALIACSRNSVPVGAAVVAALLAAPATAEINLELRPVSRTVFLGLDDEVEIGLFAVSDNAGDQLLAALQVIIQWDPGLLELLGNHGDGAVAMLSSGFPADPFGLNEANPPQDGNGIYVGFAPIGNPAAATPAGSLITTFVFRPLAVTPGTPIDILHTAGDPPGETIVFDGKVANLDVTGTISGGVVEIAPCCPPDLDFDCNVGITDFLTLLAEWGTDPGGPPDLDGDGDVGITDFLLLLAAWGPCP